MPDDRSPLSGPPDSSGGGGPMRTPWGPVAASCATVAIVIISVFVASLLVRAFGNSEDMRRASEIVGGELSADAVQQVLPYLLAWMVISQAAMVGQTWYLSGLFGGEPRRVLALEPPRGGMSAYIMSFLILGAFVILYNAMGYLFFRQAMVQDLKPFVGMVSGDWWWLTFLVVAVGAPLSEEFVFRGFLFPALAQTRLGIPGAAVLSSLGWTLLHAGYSMAGLIEVFLIGVLFAWLTWKAGSIWVSIAAHGAYNALVLLVIASIGLPA